MPSEITVVGLGPGPARLMTVEAAEVLRRATVAYVRTSQHPTVQALPSVIPDLQIESFDWVYEGGETFEDVYRRIADEVLTRCQGAEIVYAVPGSPSVGETTVRLLMERLADTDVTIRLVQGVSFIEPVLAAVGMTDASWLEVIDATEAALLAVVLGVLAPHHPAARAQRRPELHRAGPARRGPGRGGGATRADTVGIHRGDGVSIGPGPIHREGIVARTEIGDDVAGDAEAGHIADGDGVVAGHRARSAQDGGVVDVDIVDGGQGRVNKAAGGAVDAGGGPGGVGVARHPHRPRRWELAQRAGRRGYRDRRRGVQKRS